MAPNKQQTLGDYKVSHCPTCGDAFDSEHGVAAHHWQAHGEKLGVKQFECDNCGKAFERPRAEDYDHNFCSSDCMYEYQTGETNVRYNSITVECETCGEELTRNPSHVRERSFCDHGCYGMWLSKNVAGENHHQWDRVAVECEQCGSELLRKRHRIDGRNHFCDRKCYNTWHRENSTPADLVTAVRRHLSERSWEAVADEYREQTEAKCEWCDRRVSGETRFDVHHIIPVSGGGVNEPELLMYLCRSCHMKAERYTKALPEVRNVLLP